MHHDTITGTSLTYIIYNQSVSIQYTLDRNAEVLKGIFKNLMRDELALKLADVNICMPKLNTRNLCMPPASFKKIAVSG